MLPFWHKGFAPHFPLPAALPARPHACGHANIARYSLQRLRRPVGTMGLRSPRFSIVAAAPSACLSFRTALLGRCFGYWLRSSSALSKSLRFLCLPLAAPCFPSGTRALRRIFLSLPPCQLVRMPAGMRTLRAATLRRLRRPVRTMGLHPPRFSIVASAPSAYLSFRTAPPGRRFGCWLRSSAALSRNLRFLHLPLAAPCRSLSSRGLAFRFPLPAALPARPHACGHANIARYSLQRLRRPVRTMGLRPIPWQEPEVPAPPSCRSMLPLLPPFRLF